MTSTIVSVVIAGLQLQNIQVANVRSEWTGLAGSRIRTRIFSRGTAARSASTLVVILHGDAPFNAPTYQYGFARNVVNRFHAVTVAALLRPGYADDSGDRSDGIRGTATADNYTPEVLQSLSASIAQLKSEINPAAVIIVGHSGGAVLAADLLELHPDIASATLLVSCPCDVAEWREHMKRVSPTPLWDLPVRSVSPMDHIASIDPRTRISMIAGEDDPIAPETLTLHFAQAVRRHGGMVRIITVPSAGHELLLKEIVLTELARLL